MNPRAKDGCRSCGQPTRGTERCPACLAQCYNRCGRDRVNPSAYCQPCATTNATTARDTGRGPLPAGANIGRCSACRRLFHSEAAFDSHRHDGDCLDPAQLGLAEQNGVWATPEGHAHRAALANRLPHVKEARSRSAGVALTADSGTALHR